MKQKPHQKLMSFMELEEKKSKTEILKNFLIAVTIIGLSSLPYIHDIITVRNGDLQGWVPDWGLKNLLTDNEGYVLGFSNYRVFIYTLSIHLFAHIGYAAWFFEARGKLYRPFILVPVILSMYQVFIILFDWRFTDFNQPTIKIIITISLSLLLAYNFYYNNKEIITKHFNTKKTNTKSPQKTIEN